MTYKGGAAAAESCTDKFDCQCSECSKNTCMGKPDCPCYGCLYVRQNSETPEVHVTPDSLFNAVVSNNENEIKNTLVETVKKKVIPSIKSLNKMISRGNIDEIKPLLTLNPKYDESTLDEAIKINKLNIVKLLLQKGASPIKIIKIAIINSKLTNDLKLLDDLLDLLGYSNLLKFFTDDNKNVEVFKPAYEQPINEKFLLYITLTIRDDIKIPLNEILLKYFIRSENPHAIKQLFNLNKKLKKPYTELEILMTAIEQNKMTGLKLILGHIMELPEETLNYLLDGKFRKHIDSEIFTIDFLSMYQEVTFNDKYITGIINILLDFYVSVNEIPSTETLNKAIKKGNIEIIKKILILGTPADEHTLIRAIYKGDLDVIKQLFMFRTFPIITEDDILVSLAHSSKEVLLFLMASDILNPIDFIYWFRSHSFLPTTKEGVFDILHKFYLLNANQGNKKDLKDFADTLDKICAEYNSTRSPYSTSFKDIISDTTGIPTDVAGIIKDYVHSFPSGRYWQNKVDSMYNKYLKYKNKYLHLKKQIEII